MNNWIECTRVHYFNEPLHNIQQIKTTLTETSLTTIYLGMKYDDDVTGNFKCFNYFLLFFFSPPLKLSVFFASNSIFIFLFSVHLLRTLFDCVSSV